MAHIVLTKENFESEVIRSERPVLVDFWAVWCGPCKMVEPVVDALAVEYEGKVTVGKVNVDEQPEIAGQYGIMSIPTLLVFKGGQPVETMIGVQPKPAVEQRLNAHL